MNAFPTVFDHGFLARAIIADGALITSGGLNAWESGEP